MAKPIRIRGKIENNYIAEGKCCICGREWTIKDCLNIEKEKPVERYLDGSPKKDVLDHIPHMLFCPKCHMSSGFESPASDYFGNREKYYDKEYQDILKSDEPDKIKHIKMAIYRDKDRPNFSNMNQKYYLWLYWYYDNINDKENAKYYGEKLISCANEYDNICIPIKNKEIGDYKCKSFYMNMQYILINIYRRRKEFQKSIEKINIEWSKIKHNTIKNEYEIFLEKQKQLCEKCDSNKY